jgi:putative acyl-CoA dehydrogenase
MAVTHEVFDQVPPGGETDAADDPVLREALHREGAGCAGERVRAAGRLDGGCGAQGKPKDLPSHPVGYIPTDGLIAQ